jgi:NADPH:quinone reductase-like Zn-dependent oxidoreductase
VAQNVQAAIGRGFTRKAGALTPRIDRVFDLEETAEAHRRVEDGVKIGSVVVRV